MDVKEPLTSSVRPNTMAIITMRVIKSFPYRSIKNHIFKDLDLTSTTVGQLLEKVQELCKSDPGFRAYRNVEVDTIKIYTQAHGSKTMNLVINMDHDDELILPMDKKLIDCGVTNETELSCFSRALYEEYKQNPEEKW